MERAQGLSRLLPISPSISLLFPSAPFLFLVLFFYSLTRVSPEAKRGGLAWLAVLVLALQKSGSGLKVALNQHCLLTGPPSHAFPKGLILLWLESVERFTVIWEISGQDT